MAKEQRLIDANKVIGAMQKCLDECSEEEKQSVAYFAFKSIITALKQEPTVNAVEVVRCKDCRAWDRGRISCEGVARCNSGEGGIRYRSRNDYCSKGVKVSDG